MYALDATTSDPNGSLRWSYDIGAPILDTAAFYNNRIYFGGMDTKGYALENNGTLAWSKQMYGQGFKDRWTVAGNGRVIFTPVPYPIGSISLEDGRTLLNTMISSTWQTQRQTIINHFALHPIRQPVYVFEAATGTEITPPILYTSGGSTSEHSQPVVLPNGNFHVMYRTTEGVANPGCGGTCIGWSIYLGEYNSITNDIERQDTLGPTGTNYDWNVKVFSHTDESTALMRSGDIIYIDTSRGEFGFDTTTKRTIPFVNTDPVVGGMFHNNPINVYSGTINLIQPTTEHWSDGNDFQRPTPIVDDTFYYLHHSLLIAIKGTIRP